MITDAIKEFPKQFEYEPEIQNEDKLRKHNSFVIGGMGGSGLIAGVLRAIKPELDIAAHHEYGLPKFTEGDKERRLFIAISHSGNTEETLDFFKSAIEQEHDVAVIAAKGKLIELAEEKGIPYIDMPGDKVQPRVTLGYMLRAALKMMKEDELYEEAGKLADFIKSEDFEKQGKLIADKIKGKAPIIYASRSYQTLAYNWKIKFNETGKIPAFYNTFPELNHNEMNGFDVKESDKELSEKFHFIFLEDETDHPRIKVRMEATGKMYEEKGLPVEHVSLTGKTKLEKIFNSLILGDWTAYHTAVLYGNEPEEVPMIEEFKKLIE